MVRLLCSCEAAPPAIAAHRVARTRRSSRGVAVVAAAIAALGCGPGGHGVPMWSDPSLRGGEDGTTGFHLASLQDTTALRLPCEAMPPLPPLDARFAPRVSGGASLIAARGDARVRLPIDAIWAEVPGTTDIAVAEASGAIAVWHGPDGALVDFAICPRGPVLIETVVASADQRWIVASGWRVPWRRDEPLTCIVDRDTHTARVFPGTLSYPTFDLANNVIIGRDGGFELETGAPLHCAPPPEPTPQAAAFLRDHRIAAQPAPHEIAVSHDGRLAVGWLRGQSVVAWEVASGKQLWEQHYVSSGFCMEWQFSADDRFVEAVPGRAPTEWHYAAATGEVISLRRHAESVRYGPDFRGEPDRYRRGQERWMFHMAIGYGARAPERTVIARSPDGAAIATLDFQGQLAIERGATCTPLGLELYVGDPIEFSTDGLLYAGQAIGGNVARGSVFGTVIGVWRADTGALARALNAGHGYMPYLFPSTGRVALGPVGGDDRSVGSSVHVIDALRGAELGDLRLPWNRGRHASADGTRWLIDLGGEIRLWRLGDPAGARRLTEKSAEDGLSAAAFSPDGRAIAAALARGETTRELALWTRDGRKLAVAPHRPALIDRLAFSPDGRWLAAASDDGAIRVIDSATARERGAVALTVDRASLLWWSPDSERLVIDTQRGFQVEIAIAPAAPTAMTAP